MKRVLLDTNAWVFLTSMSNRLGKNAKRILRDANTEKMLSIVSIWEIIIKQQAGKIELPGDAADYIRSRITKQRISVLPYTFEHVLAVHALAPLHKDPFDRLIVAQAHVEAVPVMTSDAIFHRYGIPVIDTAK